jgi:hypothetical protein
MTHAEQLERLLSSHQGAVLSADVLIPDNEHELNWHAFLGHHDFHHFRGDQFVLYGRGSFAPLRKRNPPIGISYLAAAWHQLEECNPDGTRGKELLGRYRWRKQNPDSKDNLRLDLTIGGSESRGVLALWDEFGSGIPYAYAYLLFDSAVLASRFSLSFRSYLQQTTARLTGGDSTFGLFPKLTWERCIRYGPAAWTPLEEALAGEITRDFAVGIEVAHYLFSHWLLGFWYEDRSAMFNSYKHDENAVNFGEKCRWYTDRGGFLDFCYRLRPDLPPCVINECIWLHQHQRCKCLDK